MAIRNTTKKTTKLVVRPARAAMAKKTSKSSAKTSEKSLTKKTAKKVEESNSFDFIVKGAVVSALYEDGEFYTGTVKIIKGDQAKIVWEDDSDPSMVSLEDIKPIKAKKAKADYEKPVKSASKTSAKTSAKTAAKGKKGSHLAASNIAKEIGKKDPIIAVVGKYKTDSNRNAGGKFHADDEEAARTFIKTANDKGGKFYIVKQVPKEIANVLHPGKLFNSGAGMVLAVGAETAESLMALAEKPAKNKLAKAAGKSAKTDKKAK